MLLGDVILLINNLKLLNTETLAAIVTLPLVLSLPVGARLIFKIKIDENTEILFFVFIFLAQFLGSCVNLYDLFSWYDVFIHMLSGVLSSYIALLILKSFQKSKNNIIFDIIFIFGVVFIIAGVWELFEFIIDNVFSTDMQHVIDSGVSDTMSDMFSAYVGALFFNIFYYYKKNIIS